MFLRRRSSSRLGSDKHKQHEEGDRNSNSSHPTQSEQLTKCLETAHFYQSMFRNVPTISSEDFATRDISEYDIVDVRTDPERALSRIQNAKTLQQFEPSDKPVVVYCTIGYRSGWEASRLQKQYPQLQVYNLDGFVAFTHYAEPNQIEGSTVVHTFGSMWNFVDTSHYQSTNFPLYMLPFRLLQVGGRVIVRSIQTGLCCCR